MLIARQFIALPLIDHLLIATVLMFNLVAPRLGMWTYSLFALPGVVAHELAHFAVAFLLRAKPTFPNLIPKRDGNSWRLGSVQAASNLITSIPIALAPFMLFPVGLWYAVFIMSAGVGWWHIIHAWIAGTILIASLPSRQDWSVALPAIVCALALILWLVNR
jgi:hypothetical protein